jgi:ABC-type antimicrobial peptide transport system permease subunit
VVEHIKGHTLLKAVRGQIYMPFEQCARWHLSYVVRGDGDLRSMVPTIREELAKLNPNLAIAKVQSMNDYVARAMAPTNFTVVLAGIFAGLALLLAAIGIYGVITYSLGQRTREIGVRLALGACQGDILRLVVKEGLTLTVVGLAIGVVASLLLSGYLNSLLFGVSPTDPITYVVISAVIPLVALTACWRPARKAASGNAMDVLRQSA